jgi:hypothetical protein
VRETRVFKASDEGIVTTSAARKKKKPVPPRSGQTPDGTAQPGGVTGCWVVPKM